MISAARKENKRAVSGRLLGNAFTVFLTGKRIRLTVADPLVSHMKSLMKK